MSLTGAGWSCSVGGGVGGKGLVPGWAGGVGVGRWLLYLCSNGIIYRREFYCHIS